MSLGVKDTISYVRADRTVVSKKRNLIDILFNINLERNNSDQNLCWWRPKLTIKLSAQDLLNAPGVSLYQAHSTSPQFRV